MKKNSLQKHYYWLDPLRFLMAFMVVVSHARALVLVPYGLLPSDQKNLLTASFYAVSRLGNESVIVFFVLSGFLVGGRSAGRILRGTFNLFDYAVDRISRIYLPLIPAMVLAVFAGLEEPSVYFGNLFSLQGIFVPVLKNNAALWSLSYEVWFYVLMGSVGAVAAGKRPAGAVLITVVFLFFTKLNPAYLFCWLLGILAYWTAASKARPLWLAAAAGLIIYGVTAVQFRAETMSIEAPVWLRFLPQLNEARVLLASGAALLVQQIVSLKPQRSWGIKIDEGGTRLAAASYTLYLIHYPVMAFMLRLAGFEQSPDVNPKALLFFLACIAASLAAAWIFYQMFEKRTGALRAMIKNRAMPKATPE